MSLNLLDLVKDQVSGQLLKGATGFLGESESAVGSALDGIFPSLLGSMVEKGSSESGASALMNIIKDNDDSILDNIGGLFSGGSSMVDGLLGSGSGILSMLMGDKVGGMVDMIAKMAGIKSGSATTLIKMAAPFLMSIIGRQVRKGGLGVSGLMDMLSGQKDHVKSAMPSGMGSLLGLPSLGFIGDAVSSVVSGAGDVVSGAANVAGDAVGAVGDAGKKVVGGAADIAGKGVDAAGDVARGTVDAGKKVVGGAANLAGKGVDAVGDVGGAAVKTGGSILKWLIPLFLVLMLLSWFFGFRTGCDAVDSTVDSAKDVTESVAGGAADLAGDAAGAVGDAAGAVGDAVGNAVAATGDVLTGAFNTVSDAGKAALDKVTFAAGSAGEQMMNFVKGGFKGDNRFRFNNLTFDTGSATISGQSGAEVDNLAAILNAYTDVKIQVQGYTDNQGDADKNKMLSDARAQAVKARLIGKGIDASRISTVGYGDANPVADNNTADGREANRRVEIQIVQ